MFDNRGAGQTKDDCQPFTIDQMAKDVIDLANILGLEKPHIVGHSMGGTIAQRIAVTYPEKINKLGILASSAKWRTAMLIALKTSMTMREKNMDLNIILDHLISLIYGESFLKNPDNIVRFKQAVIGNAYPQSLHDQKRQFKILEHFDGIEQLKLIKTKTLIVYGIEDLLALPEESKLMADNIPDSKLISLNCGHGFVLELPQDVTKMLVEFFK
ncbi:MAG: alpha/beta fold hydrolase [Gammaproteobacteria bacterium]